MERVGVGISVGWVLNPFGGWLLTLLTKAPFIQGDSGGPLNYNGMTYGITSFGASVGCEKGYPDAFTRVNYYLDWIETKTGVTP